MMTSMRMSALNVVLHVLIDITRLVTVQLINAFQLTVTIVVFIIVMLRFVLHVTMYLIVQNRMMQTTTQSTC
ncbi:hypothetical protein AYY17_15245 [Morganella psychrotolerans]|uniref:Uncharacterized protein n=1 Tax=Morganella psychrotolerans TaxID=368603 RepID=A0A1B8HM59_9GAMM|nr:hypothetical protein AYY17_15245 [Morganella psychrotolerans]